MLVILGPKGRRQVCRMAISKERSVRWSIDILLLALLVGDVSVVVVVLGVVVVVSLVLAINNASGSDVDCDCSCGAILYR